jgi:hypothetical protein
MGDTRDEYETGEENANPDRVGPYDIERTPDVLTLRFDNRGEVGVKGCLFFVVGMICILSLGVLSVIQSADTKNQKSASDPSHMFGIYTNQSGFLWILLTVAMCILLPLYLWRLQHSAAVFTFDKVQKRFARSGKTIASFAKLEHVRIRETKDPDQRYLYEVELLYGDGYSVFLHNTYEEREAGNLAKEIAVFVEIPVVWQK